MAHFADRVNIQVIEERESYIYIERGCFCTMRQLAVILAFLCAVLATAGATFAQEEKAVFFVDQKSYLVDGQERHMDVAPYIDENGRMMVPVRFLALALGVPEECIVWVPEERLVVLHDGRETTVFLKIGSRSCSYSRGKPQSKWGTFFGFTVA